MILHLEIAPYVLKGEGVRKNPRLAAKVLSIKRTKFLTVNILFMSGQNCNHPVFTARMHKIAGFGSIFSNFGVRGHIKKTRHAPLGKV